MLASCVISTYLAPVSFVKPEQITPSNFAAASVVTLVFPSELATGVTAASVVESPKAVY